MADTTISLEALKDFQKTAQDINLQTFIDGIEQSGQKMASMGDVAARVGPQIADAILKATKSLGEFGTTAQSILQNGVELWNNLEQSVLSYVSAQENSGEDTASLFLKAASVLDSFIGVIPDSITGIGKFGEAGKIAGSSITESFKDIAPMLKIIGTSDFVISGFSRMATQADNAYQVQRSLISLAASQGQLNSVVDDGTNSFQTIDLAMTNMSDSAFESAQATGQTVASMMDLATSLGKIPGAISDNIDIGGLFSSQLVVTSQIASAFGQSQTDVAKTLNALYETVGLRGTESMQVISSMYTAAGDSKLRFEGFSKSVMDIATNFKMLGDNTGAATNIVKAFDTAFKDSEISPQAMQQVIGSMAAGIQGMDRGRQAFVSAATGGPGGLAGAFQIELAMQEGRMDEVMQKTMTAMQQQFGGQILTLKDAGENPALAGEFYKQVQYLTQVAGIAKDDREAYRILEAMSAGVTDMLMPGASGVPDGQDALVKATDRGFAEQQRTTSAVVAIHQGLERARLYEINQSGQRNTALNETVGLGDSMQESIGASGSRGVRSLATNEGFRSSIVSRSEDDARIELADRLSSGLSSLRSNLRTFGGGEESDLASTPVGAGVTLPGVTARAPAGPAAIIGAGGGGTRSGKSPLDVFAETGAFPAMPVTVEHSPIQVRVDLGEPFDKAVTTIVRREIQDSNAAQNVRANGGT